MTRRRGGEDLQARRQLRHGARSDRRGRARRGALLLPHAEGRLAARRSTSTSRARSRRRIRSTTSRWRTRGMCGIFRVGGIDPATVDRRRRRPRRARREPEEQELIKALLDFPALVAGAAEALEPHRVATYLLETAGLAHLWYHKHHVLERAGADHARASRARPRARRSCCATGCAFSASPRPSGCKLSRAVTRAAAHASSR